jgi:hypothetical protein
MKPYLKIAIAVIVLIGLAGAGTGFYLFNKKHQDLLKARPDFIVSSIDLQKEFETDETAATSRYINKIIEVSGIVGQVRSGEEDILSVSLNTGSYLSSVICTFPSKTDPGTFKEGSRVTIRGECSGFLMDVLLNNCVIVK